MRKGPGQESMLCYLANLVMDVRHGLVRSVRTGIVGSESEVGAAVEMAKDLDPGSVLAADKGYDCAKFRSSLRALDVKGHPVPKAKHSSVDGRTTRHPSFQESMRERPKIEKIFGWIKQESRMRQTRFRGKPKVALSFELHACAYNLLRIANLTA